MLKVRTMWAPERPLCSERGLIEWIDREPESDDKSPDDPRISSRFAALCRRHSIDELPQLWHVVRGQMALVGPRPVTRGELVRHYGSSAAEVLSLRPGLTGLWQIEGRSRLSYARRVRLDIELTRTYSLRTYLSVLWRTLPVLISGNGAC
jgi:lipopolysaccharide/colanic/teichoic acid biosynthesis glycosyltransferase